VDDTKIWSDITRLFKGLDGKIDCGDFAWSSGMPDHRTIDCKIILSHREMTDGPSYVVVP
jgi:hypothetical protein